MHLSRTNNKGDTGLQSLLKSIKANDFHHVKENFQEHLTPKNVNILLMLEDNKCNHIMY